MNEDQEIKIGLTCSDDANNSEIPNSSEWKNGDECVINPKSKSKWFVVGVSPLTKTSTVCVSNTGELKPFHTDKLKKPETQEQREERERLEAAYDLYCLRCDAIKWSAKYSFDEFKEEDDAVNGWLAVVDKTNYRLTK